MGAGVSSILGPEGEGGAPEMALGDLPESCVAAVLLYLDPPEICRVARLNRAFRGAASADFVWEAKLPANYRYLMGLVTDDEEKYKSGLSKKEIYARLCRPNPFDGGTKEFWLEKVKGGMCLSISSKALVITGIDDRRYWNHMPTEESRDWRYLGEEDTSKEMGGGKKQSKCLFVIMPSLAKRNCCLQ